MGTETLVTIVAIPVVNFLVQRAKTKRNVKGEIVLVGVAVVVGLVYTAFKMLVPEALQTSATTRASQVGFYAVLVYEFLLKKKKS